MIIRFRRKYFFFFYWVGRCECDISTGRNLKYRKRNVHLRDEGIDFRSVQSLYSNSDGCIWYREAGAFGYAGSERYCPWKTCCRYDKQGEIPSFELEGKSRREVKNGGKMEVSQKASSCYYLFIYFSLKFLWWWWIWKQIKEIKRDEGKRGS